MTSTTRRTVVAAALTGAALFTAAAPQAAAAPGPGTPPAFTASTMAAAHRAATASTTLDTLSRFFAREGAVTRSAAAPRIEGEAVAVRTLAPDFVAGKAGAALTRLEYLATTAVSSDGQKATLWTVPKDGTNTDWQVVNIATGDDESRYTAAGARRLPGGTVFREPQIDAWYVHKGARVLPLDEDAARAVGEGGTTLSAYGNRVRKEYGDKLPGSGYAHSGKAGGYAPGTGPEPGTEKVAARQATAAAGTHDTALTVTSAVAGAGALLVLVSWALTTVRRDRRRRETLATGA
ncbi:hypothetical protein OG230_08600 [Streptomyces sp. NBC_00234]|uniref:hypothetical protein n=1 Tax=Streptomyces sp. NBC_00234 TaxID=2903638 RepID=UPI002E2A3022|nr:hypothetical protein [Streptomyces sp. NBC_00234]